MYEYKSLQYIETSLIGKYVFKLPYEQTKFWIE